VPTITVISSPAGAAAFVCVAFEPVITSPTATLVRGAFEPLIAATAGAAASVREGFGALLAPLAAAFVRAAFSALTPAAGRCRRFTTPTFTPFAAEADEEEVDEEDRSAGDVGGGAAGAAVGSCNAAPAVAHNATNEGLADIARCVIG